MNSGRGGCEILKAQDTRLPLQAELRLVNDLAQRLERTFIPLYPLLTPIASEKFCKKKDDLKARRGGDRCTTANGISSSYSLNHASFSLSIQLRFQRRMEVVR